MSQRNSSSDSLGECRSSRQNVAASAVMICSKSYRGRYTSPALAAASYLFVDLPSGDTLRCKLFPNGKFHKICYLFDSQ